MPLRVKGKVIGEGKPLICAPIVEDTKDGILSECRSLMDAPAEMIEWRVDLFEEAENTEEVLSVLQRLYEIAGEKVLLFTYRSIRQGGNGRMPGSQIEKLLCAAAKSGNTDIIDLEYFMSPDPKKLIRSLKQDGAVTLASHHDFEETPPPEVMLELLSDMERGGADIVKLAVMPHDMDDVLRLLSATERFRKTCPGKPVVSMSMGKYGSLSRLCGEFFGIAVTFGAHSRASAPGQIDLGTLAVLLDRIHQSYEGGAK